MRIAALVIVGIAVGTSMVVAAIVASMERLAGSEIFVSEKVCQLTGEWDKERDKPTRNAGKQFGITGTDLGFPVPWKNELYFIFGDTRSTDPDVYNPDDEGYDSIAVGPLKNDDVGVFGRYGAQHGDCVALDFSSSRSRTTEHREDSSRRCPE